MANLERVEPHLEPRDDEQEFQIVVVHRYDNPDRFGVHRSAPDPTWRNGFSHNTLGLWDVPGRYEICSHLLRAGFTEHKFEDLSEQEQHRIVHTCCPIEWHSIMDQPVMMARVVVYKWKRA